MNKAEYMRELERLLQNIPENERVEALTYYEEYFNDAGEENEQQVISELGAPSRVADNIKEGLRGSMGYQNTGTGYQNTGFQHIGTQNVYTGTPPAGAACGNGGNSNTGEMPAWAIVLIVIGCIFVSPILLGVAGTALGMIASAVLTLLGCIIGFGAGAVALLVAGIVCMIVGFPALFIEGFAGMVLLGVGLLLMAIGLLMLLATIWLCGWALPTFIKWIIRMCKKPFHKKQNGGM